MSDLSSYFTQFLTLLDKAPFWSWAFLYVVYALLQSIYVCRRQFRNGGSSRLYSNRDHRRELVSHFLWAPLDTLVTVLNQLDGLWDSVNKLCAYLVTHRNEPYSNR